MSDSHDRTLPDWLPIVTLMQDMSRKLPADWDHDTAFILDAVQCIAEAVCAMNDAGIPLEFGAKLLSAGGILIAQMVKKAEGANLASALMARLNRREGDLHD